MLRPFAWFALWLLGACAYDVIELGPKQALGVEVIVVGNVPAQAIDRLQSSAAGKADAKRLGWAYPEETLALPANVAPLTFQWKGDKPAKMPAAPDTKNGDVYELRLIGPSSELRIYTTDTRFALDPGRWTRLLGASVAGDITCALRGLATDKKGELFDGSTRTIAVRGPLPGGSIFFASSGGIVRADIADSAATPVVLPTTSGAASCLEGLAISGDGSRLSTACSGTTGGIWTLPTLGAVRSIAPDPARVASALDGTGTRSAEARDDALVVLDATTGALLQTVVAGHSAAPDWSPDSRVIVFVRTEQTTPALPATMMMAPASGPAAARDSTSIVRVEQLADGSWSAPIVVVAASADTGPVLRAPRFSPDGAWIAFAGADTPSDEVADARLFVVRAQGGTPVRFGVGTAADPMTKPMMMAEKRGSGSLPSWLPGDRPDRAWLIFSSTRDVAAATPETMPAAMPESTLRQLWISAVDLLPAEPGIDVTRPAFWLPAQPVASDNRNATFARSTR